MSYNIRTLFKGCYQDINLSASASLVEVKAAIASTFDISEGKDSLYLTYRNSYGREVRFDGDAEAVIFLRLCGNRLEVVVDVDGAAKDTSCVNLEVRSLDSHCSKTDDNSVVPGAERSGDVSPTMRQDLDDSIWLLKLRPRRVVARSLGPKKFFEDEEVSNLLCHPRGEKKPWHEHHRKLRNSEGFGDADRIPCCVENFSRERKSGDSDNIGRDKDNRYLDEKRTTSHSIDPALVADKVERKLGNVEATTPHQLTAPQE